MCEGTWLVKAKPAVQNNQIGNYVHLASLVASYARESLFAVMLRVGLENVYYCDTDSIFIPWDKVGVLQGASSKEEPAPSPEKSESSKANMFDDEAGFDSDFERQFGKFETEAVRERVKFSNSVDLLSQTGLGKLKLETDKPIKEARFIGSKMYELTLADDTKVVKVKGINVTESVPELPYLGSSLTIPQKQWKRGNL